jgi:hypothetical protein
MVAGKLGSTLKIKMQRQFSGRDRQASHEWRYTDWGTLECFLLMS